MILVACPSCSADNDARRRGCLACGGSLELSCARCHFANRAGDRFCGGCGAALESSNGAAAAHAPAADSLAGVKRDELRTITVMMADLEGFAEMNERFGRERQADVMNAVFARLAEKHVVAAFDGYVDKFLDGDIMALFGAPVAHEDSPERALRAAVRMHEELAALHADGTVPAETPLKMRIGLNTGPVRVGGMGAGGRMEYTAMGDTVNLAARLMTACAWGQTLISTNTHRRTAGSFELEALPPVKVKGKSQPVPIWSVTAERRRAARIELAASAGMSRLVGREELLTTLLRDHDEARLGHGHAVGVRGEAGIGKSRLVFELQQRLDAATEQYLEGRCVSYGVNISYLPVREVLWQLCGILDADSADVREGKLRAAIADTGLGADDPAGADLAPAVGVVLGLDITDEAFDNLEPLERRRRVREAFLTFMRAAAARRPVVVFFDDLQWLDGDSAELLDDLIAALHDTPVLVLMAYRPDFQPPWHFPWFEQVDPPRLTPQQTRQVVGSLLHSRGLIEDELRIDDSLASAVHYRSQGNPFFIDQTITALVERAEQTGQPTIDFRRGRLLIPEQQLGDLVPDSVEEILLARIDKLPGEARDVLQAASVALIGRSFRRSALEYTLGGQDVSAALDALQRRDLVRREHRDAADEEYGFEQALTRDVAYNALLRSERRRLHGRMGYYIEAHYATSLDAYLDDLSYHFYNSAEAERALVYLPRSAERAALMYSNQQAVLHYKRALERVVELGEGSARDHLHLSLLKGLVGVQSTTRDRDLLDNCRERVELARRIGDSELLIDASFMLAHCTGEMGLFDEARAAWGEILEAYEAAERWDGVRDTEFGIGNFYYLQGRFHQALGHFERAELIQRQKLPFDPFGQWAASNNLAAIYETTGRFTDMLEACAVCEDMLAQLDDNDPMRLRLSGYTQGNLGSAHRNLGHLDEALASYTKTLAVAEATGERNIEAEVRCWMGRALLLGGRLDEAEAQLDEAHALAKETEHSRWEAGALVDMAEVARLRGDLDGAAARLDEARAVLERVGKMAAAEELALGESRLALARGDAAQAAILAEQAAAELSIAQRDAERAGALADLAQALFAAGKRARAADVAEQAAALAERMGLQLVAQRVAALRTAFEGST
jgi:class 3 adenylate cyclase/tetratricopeptide (TPR) repeat protein